MKTVCLSANTSWYLYNFRANTIKALQEKGYAVVCLSPEDAYSVKLEDELGCEWRPLQLDNDGKSVFRDLRLFVDFFRIYREVRPIAACHFTIKNNMFGTLAAASLKIPSINNVSGLGTAFITKGWVGWLAMFLYRVSQPFAFKVYCQNIEDLEFLKKYKLTPAGKTELLPGSGVDLNRFTPSLCERREPSAPIRYLYAGRLLAQKGLYELLEAFDRLSQEGVDSELWLIGFSNSKNISAIDQDTLDKWSERDNIRMMPPSDNIEMVYSQVDCIVLPSYREGLPRTLLEANAMALPVITTDVPGCRNVVTDGVNGLLCKAKSSDSLYDTIKRFEAMSVEERDNMGQRGRALVAEKYSEALVIDAYTKSIHDAEGAERKPLFAQHSALK